MAKKLINQDGSDMALPRHIALPKDYNPIDRIFGEVEVIDPKTVVPTEYRVLLKIAGVEYMTKSGIFTKTPEEISRELMAKTDAVLVSSGAMAFTTSTGDYLPDTPKEGDRVLTTKYPGTVYRDKQNNLYRFANDKDVIAIVRG